MKTPFGIRLWILIIVLVFVAGSTIYGLFASLRRIEELEAKFSGSQIELPAGGRSPTRLLNLNNSMLRYAMLRDSREWESSSGQRRLNNWIDQHDPSVNPKSPLTTDTERKLLQELNRDYDTTSRPPARSVPTHNPPS
jgi:hypothetical protein